MFGDYRFCWQSDEQLKKAKRNRSLENCSNVINIEGVSCICPLLSKLNLTIIVTASV